MMNQSEMYLYDYLVETDIATPAELNLSYNLIGGRWIDVLNAVLYIRTGYKDLDAYMEAEDEE